MADVTALLDGLDKGDQDQLLETLLYRRSQLSGGDAPSREEQTMWDALNRVVSHVGKAPPLPVVMKSVGRKKFREAASHLHAFIERSCGTMIRQPVRVIVAEKTMEALADYLRARSIPVTSGSMLNSFGMLSDAVDAQFPGYAEARLLHRVAALATS